MLGGGVFITVAEHRILGGPLPGFGPQRAEA